MLDARALRGLVPRLRRHAFLLTASRLAADIVVAMTIARLPRDEADRPQASALPVLFALMQEAARQVVCPQDGALIAPHDRLAALPPQQRAMLVLVVVEGLPESAAAAVCGLDADEGAAILAAARGALGSGLRGHTPRARQGGGGARR